MCESRRSHDKVCYFWHIKFRPMKIIMTILMIAAILIAFYEQSKEDSSPYIMIIAFVVFMFGMMRLSSNTPSKNQSEDDEEL